MSNDNISLQVAWVPCFPKKVTAALGGLSFTANGRKAAGEGLARLITQRLTHEAKRCIVVGHDGTVLVGETSPEGGGLYTITGRDRPHPTWVSCAHEVRQTMRDHVNNSYGGVAWEGKL